MVIDDDHQKELKEFGLKLNTANWYIGISAYQERHIMGLSGTLRDDFEQGTSFRVQKFLQEIGLQPLMSNKNVLRIVQMSRGNALAFLFFVLEGFYKTPRENGQFSTNEKLLMIAIAKLDLLPTMRGLDRILPPPQYGKFEVQHKEQSEFDLRAYSMKLKHMKSFVPVEEKKNSIRKKAYKLPYFERQPRPKQIPLRMTSRPADFVVSFPFWPRKGSPDYGKETGAPWFTEFKLNPMNRLLRTIICEAVDKYFNLGDLEILANNDKRIMSTYLNAKKAIDNKPNFCLYHKGVAASAQLLKDELIVKARDRYMEMLDVTKIENKKRTERILAQLEHDIKECMDRNEAMMRTDLTKVQILSQGECVLCRETHVPIPWPPKHQKDGRALVGSCTNLAHTMVADDDKLMGKQLIKTFVGPVDFHGLSTEEPCEPSQTRKAGGGGGNCDSNDSNLGKKLCRHGIAMDKDPCTGSGNSKAFVIASDELKPKEDSKDAVKSPKCDVILIKSQTKKSFFQAPTSNSGPYKFKYHRIFNTGQKPYNMQKHIAKTFVKALNKPVEKKIIRNSLFNGQQSCSRVKCSDIASQDTDDPTDRQSDTTETTEMSSSHSRQSHIDYRANVVDAVVKCVRKIWKYMEAIKREEMENTKKVSTPIVLKYDMEYFDPNDQDLMDRMLADGMKELQKDQRFVLASLPESHKMPVLREWIKRRFGKSYTQKELITELEESNRIFEIVQAMQTKPPNADLMGIDHYPTEDATYRHWEKVKALGVKARKAYIVKLNNIYMQQMNACWYAMGNYKNSAGPPRKVFYAYMAANPRGIIRQHVWNGEFRNYRKMRDFSRKNKS